MKEEIIHIPCLKESYTKILHKSGLTILFSEKDFTASFAILGVGFGSAYEKASADGVPLALPYGTAHFLEHKMFENPDGEDSFVKFSRTGANANAYTSTDKTCYLFSATEQPESALAILLDGVFSPCFTTKSVSREKPIIIEELKMYKDDPVDTLYHRLLGSMYDTCPVRNDVCGTVSTVRSITAKDLTAAYELFYTPDNMVLSLCGRFDKEQVLKILDEYLPVHRKKSYRKLTLPQEKNRADCRRRYARMTADIATPMVAIGIKGSVFPKGSLEALKRFCQMNILAHALFSASGEFVSSLITENIVPEEPDYEIVHNRIYSHIIFAAGCYRPGLLKRRFFARLKHLRENGVEKEEFIRGKRILYADLADNFNSTEECATGYMSDALEGLETKDMADAIATLTIEEVNEAAKVLLCESSVSIVVCYPKNKNSKKGSEPV